MDLSLDPAWPWSTLVLIVSVLSEKLLLPVSWLLILHTPAVVTTWRVRHPGVAGPIHFVVAALL